jgi:predicted nuclease with TOPRIM domain
LTDPTSTKNLQTKLEAWLRHYDAFIDEPNRGESDQDFKTRREEVRNALEKEWSSLTNDAVSALRGIELLGEKLEKIRPGAISAPEWRRYKELLRNERNIANFLSTSMPTAPCLLARMRETVSELREVVDLIDKCAEELDQAKKRLGSLRSSPASLATAFERISH